MSIIIQCPACGTRNRVQENSTQKPICGKCHTPLIIHRAAAPIQLTDATFDNFINNTHKPVLVDFWAAWCAPCRMLAPILETFNQSQTSISVAKVDTEKNPLTASRFQIFSIPTMILFIAGQEVKRIQGAVPLQVLEKELSKWISIN